MANILQMTFSNACLEWKIAVLSGIILGMGSANTGRRYIVTTSLIGWFHTQNDPCALTQISLKFVPKGPIHNKSALVQVMAWHQTGDKPLPEPRMTQLTDSMWRQWATMS